MKIFLGADHRGFELKEKIKTWLIQTGQQIEDCGATEIILRDDYVDFAKDVSQKVISEEGSRGILICGSGAGMNIASNKIKGVRCSIGFNIEQVRSSRNDDNLNILVLASDYIFFDNAKDLIDTFLTSSYNPTDNHVRRLDKIKHLESENFS